jgi:hypothetical protein
MYMSMSSLTKSTEMNLPNRSTRIAARWLVALTLAAASLACGNAPQAPDSQATVAAFYATITAQAESGVPFPTVAAPTDLPATDAATPTFTPSPTPPASREGNGINLTIRRCQVIIGVNGDDSDWKNAGAASFQLGTATFGKSEWQGNNDLFGEAQMCWTDSALYLWVSVTDDIHVQTETGITSWKGDEIEFFFDGDLRGDFYDDSYDRDDSQLGLSPGNFDSIPPNTVEYRPTQGGNTTIEIAARRAIGTGGNYVLEAGIPWALLRTVPEANTNYGLCVAISDNDHVNVARQDSMVSNCTNLLTPDPTTFATVTLQSN